MFGVEKENLRIFQEFIGYEFNNQNLLIEALTTPSLANEIGRPSYDFLETLGDAVIKIILILKLYKKGIKESGEITKIKATLENNKALNHIARKIDLEKYILKGEKQRIKGTNILADIFEAICGALFLDSEYNLNLVEKIMINPFYEDFNEIIQASIISSKNELLEFLQKKFNTNIVIELDYEKSGAPHKPIWIAKNPKILDQNTRSELIKIPQNLESASFKSKKSSDKDLYAKILSYLKSKET